MASSSWLEERWIEEQARLRGSLSLPPEPPGGPLPSLPLVPPVSLEQSSLYGGCDLTEPVDESLPSVASFAVVDHSLSVVHEQHEIVAVAAPYVPSFLSFREAPAICPLVRAALSRGVSPDYLLLDGNGLLHPAGFGLASHVGVLLGVPTIGVSKSLHVFPGLRTGDGKEVGAKRMKALFRSFAKVYWPRNHAGLPKGGILVLDRHLAELAGEELAREEGAEGGGGALRSPPPPSCCLCLFRDGVPGVAGCAFLKGGGGSEVPVYVSVGSGVNLATALHVVDHMSVRRVAEPVRVADLGGREFIRNYKA